MVMVPTSVLEIIREQWLLAQRLSWRKRRKAMAHLAEVYLPMLVYDSHELHRLKEGQI